MRHLYVQYVLHSVNMYEFVMCHKNKKKKKKKKKNNNNNNNF